MQILIVKITSMGDIVQTLPAVSDLKHHNPNAQIDWLVDESFAEIPSWHPAIRKVYTLAHRRWKKHLGTKQTYAELATSVRALRTNSYDYILDAQGNLKSAISSCIARGKVYGMDRASIAEKPAHWLYSSTFSVVKQQLAIDRTKSLFAQALGYQPSKVHNFAIDSIQWKNHKLQPAKPYLVFVTQASWQTKQLSQQTWRELIQHAANQGFRILLPWGSKTEYTKVVDISQGLQHAVVLPRLDLSSIASLLFFAQGSICSDTGLAHLSAALTKPTLTLYGPTNPNLIGATGEKSFHLSLHNSFNCAPCYKKYCVQNPHQQEIAKCLEDIESERIWRSFSNMLD